MPGRPREAGRVGRPWAPYALESRVLGIQAAYLDGDWDGALDLADVRGRVAAGPGGGDADRQRAAGARRAR